MTHCRSQLYDNTGACLAVYRTVRPFRTSVGDVYGELNFVDNGSGMVVSDLDALLPTDEALIGFVPVTEPPALPASGSHHLHAFPLLLHDAHLIPSRLAAFNCSHARQGSCISLCLALPRFPIPSIVVYISCNLFPARACLALRCTAAFRILPLLSAPALSCSPCCPLPQNHVPPYALALPMFALPVQHP